MFYRRQAYLLAVVLSLCLLYLVHITIPFSPSSIKFLSFSTAGSNNHNYAVDNNSSSISTSLDPIVITLVVIGQPAAQEGLVTIKSAIMHSSRPLDIHLICSEDAIEIIEPKIRLIKRPYYALNIMFHVVPLARVEERLERANVGTEARNWPMLSKLLMHEILVDVEKTIFVDTDMIFVVDPIQLWEGFDTLDEKVLLALPTLGPTSHPGQICTCVMLLRLDRLRRPAPDTLFIPSPGHKDMLTEAFEAAEKNGVASWSGTSTIDPFTRKNAPFGDQGTIYALWSYRPDLFAHLSLRWDITQCRSSYGLQLWGFVDKDGKLVEDDSSISEEEHIKKQIYHYGVSGEDLLVPGIIHFNCQPDAGDNVWEWDENHNSALKTWAPMVTTSVRYKWVWLNRGNGSATVSTTKKTGVQWLDEQPISIYSDEDD